MYNLYVKHILFWTSHISRARGPSVAIDYNVRSKEITNIIYLIKIRIFIYKQQNQETIVFIGAMLCHRHCTVEGRCKSVCVPSVFKLSHVNTEVIPVPIVNVSTTRQFFF